MDYRQLSSDDEVRQEFLDRFDSFHACPALTSLAWSYLEDGQTERALAIVENAYSAEGPPMMAALARRAADLGRVELARQMAGRALLSGKATVLLKEIAQLAPNVARMLIDDI